MTKGKVVIYVLGFVAVIYLPIYTSMPLALVLCIPVGCTIGLLGYWLDRKN